MSRRYRLAFRETICCRRSPRLTTSSYRRTNGNSCKLRSLKGCNEHPDDLHSNQRLIKMTERIQRDDPMIMCPKTFVRVLNDRSQHVINYNAFDSTCNTFSHVTYHHSVSNNDVCTPTNGGPILCQGDSKVSVKVDQVLAGARTLLHSRSLEFHDRCRRPGEEFV